MKQHDTIRGAEVDIKAVSHDFQLDGRRLPVLENISIKVGRGEFLSLLGPSGCRYVRACETSCFIAQWGLEDDRDDPNRP